MRKIIYRIIIINTVFWTWWEVSGLSSPPVWVITLIAISFGFIVGYDDE